MTFLPVSVAVSMMSLFVAALILALASSFAFSTSAFLAAF